MQPDELIVTDPLCVCGDEHISVKQCSYRWCTCRHYRPALADTPQVIANRRDVLLREVDACKHKFKEVLK